MSVGWAIVLFVAGLALVLFCAEQLVEFTVGTAAGFGVSAFLISVVFIGFDPENLAVGAVGSAEQAAGIALGVIIGSAMVAIALAFGLTALIAPLQFEHAPRSILLVPVAAVGLFAVLCLDGALSRGDGVVLLGGYVASVGYLGWKERSGARVAPTESVAKIVEDEMEGTSRWMLLAGFVLALAGIVIGSELLVRASAPLIAALGLSETTFGMTILALVVSIEEVARELPAALKGRPDITFGNVLGSVLAFFLFNAGVIALVRPVPVPDAVLQFYLPVSVATIALISAVMWHRAVPRWAGAVLVLLYLVFAAGGYVVPM
jgi:cation:H+ antiporter